jgi:hypothetical protein
VLFEGTGATEAPVESVEESRWYMYAKGQGVAQDYVQAHKWMNLAAANFSASESERREGAVTSRDRLAAKMTPAQIAEAQKLARQWQDTHD